MAKFLICLVCLMMMTIPVAAQFPLALVADVPFGFYAGDKWMPPGEYRFEFANNRIMLGMNGKAPEAVLFGYNGSRVSGDAKPVVVFNRYSEARIFLSNLVHPWLSSTLTVPKTKRERESVSSRVVAQVQPDTVTLVARVVR